MKYSEVAGQYEEISQNQSSAGKKLIRLIHLNGNESILDLGCGSGHLSFELSRKTSGAVMGIDNSRGMIQKARKDYGNPIEFSCESAEEISFLSKFDLVFCN